MFFIFDAVALNESKGDDEKDEKDVKDEKMEKEKRLCTTHGAPTRPKTETQVYQESTTVHNAIPIYFFRQTARQTDRQTPLQSTLLPYS